MFVKIHDEFYPLSHFLMSVDEDIFDLVISARFVSSQDFVDRYVKVWETATETPFTVL